MASLTGRSRDSQSAKLTLPTRKLAAGSLTTGTEGKQKDDDNGRLALVTEMRQDLDRGPLICRGNVVGSPSAGRVCGNNG